MMDVSVDRDRIVEILGGFFQWEAAHFGVEAAFLYGSWAAGFPRLESDIDVAVLFDDEGTSEDDAFERLNAITLALMKVLPSEINVIPIYSDFRKPMLYYNAIIKGIPLFFTNREKYVSLIGEALYHMEDFETLGKRWLIDLATRNLEQISHA